MRITFVLPMFLESPAGGFKVVYEYANRLQRRGHEVTIIHPRHIESPSGLIDQLKRPLWRWRLRWRHRHEPVPWFKLDARVKVRLVSDRRERAIPHGDAIIATAFQTAGPVAGYRAEKGRGFYLIQSYEDWMGNEDEVRATWRLPLQKIVVSRWLERMATRLGVAESTTLIPLGLDFGLFRINRPPGDQRRPRVGMLAHPLPIKGTADGLAALTAVRRDLPEIEAVLFGTEPRPADLPDWIEYHQRPDPTALVEIYNSCRIFLHPSRLEGWGLPAAEAMACGCALVAAHNEGVDEFAVDGQNALLAPVEAPSILAHQLRRLLTDHVLCEELARRGASDIQRFDWERSTGQMEALLQRPAQNATENQ
ncbi:MAG: glycosyltransferase family 4 protein [Acidobacteriota bacterium]